MYTHRTTASVRGLAEASPQRDVHLCSAILTTNAADAGLEVRTPLALLLQILLCLSRSFCSWSHGSGTSIIRKLRPDRHEFLRWRRCQFPLDRNVRQHSSQHRSVSGLSALRGAATTMLLRVDFAEETTNFPSSAEPPAVCRLARPIRSAFSCSDPTVRT